MIKKVVGAILMLIVSTAAVVNAQNALSIDKVYSAYLRNSGTIVENNQIKGYFYFYQSDKVDRRTNEYTLQILDENLNKVQNIKFTDSKDLSLLEASYNGGSLAFLFMNEKENTLDMKIYSLDGKLKYTYSREYTQKTEELMAEYTSMHADEGSNQNIFDMGAKGYISVLPLRDGRNVTYEMDFYSSESKKQWTYRPSNDEDKFAQAEYLGSVDDLVILQVMRKSRKTANRMASHLVGINVTKKKLQFDIESDEKTDKPFVPTSIMPVPGSPNILVLGAYYDDGDKVLKDATKGLAAYLIDTKGNIVSSTYNSWEEDFAKYLPSNRKGKIQDIGYLYIHKMLRTPEGKLYVVGEGYKRNGYNTAVATLAHYTGSSSNVAASTMMVTDMVVMEFDPSYKVSGATVFDKTNNLAAWRGKSTALSQHTIAAQLKATGAFDYDFTTSDADNATFNICFSDWVRGKDYKGQTFNTIRYNGTKFSTDRIELKSKASSMKVFPAKPGSVMIMEYFKKDKRLDFRLEKIG